MYRQPQHPPLLFPLAPRNPTSQGQYLLGIWPWYCTLSGSCASVRHISCTTSYSWASVSVDQTILFARRNKHPWLSLGSFTSSSVRCAAKTSSTYLNSLHRWTGSPGFSMEIKCDVAVNYKWNLIYKNYTENFHLTVHYWREIYQVLLPSTWNIYLLVCESTREGGNKWARF